MNYRLSLTLLILFLVPVLVSNGKTRTRSTKPKLVLVQLSSESNRINALTKAKRYREADEVKRDAAGVISAMVKDFEDNFTALPVYYYMDTNMEAVKNQQFEGILLDSSLTTVANPIAPGSHDYLIVYFGRPAVQPKRSKVVKDSTKYAYDSGEPFGAGLIVCNFKFEQLKYFYKLGYYEMFLGKRRKQYVYSSKHFNIEYYPLANQFNKDVPEIFE